MPSYISSTGVGGHSESTDIYSIYKAQNKRKLCDISTQKISNNVYVTLFCGLSLQQYIVASNIDCQIHHTLLDDGFFPLSKVFHLVFPTQVYKSDIAL